jgi:hypothetical protein
MEHVLTLWPIYAPAGFFVALGIGMIRLDEFAKARVFFWVSVILLGVIDFLWQCTTDAPFLFRISNGVITGIMVFLVFPKARRWLTAREAKAGTPR